MEDVNNIAENWKGRKANSSNRCLKLTYAHVLTIVIVTLVVGSQMDTLMSAPLSIHKCRLSMRMPRTALRYVL